MDSFFANDWLSAELEATVFPDLHGMRHEAQIRSAGFKVMELQMNLSVIRATSLHEQTPPISAIVMEVDRAMGMPTRLTHHGGP